MSSGSWKMAWAIPVQARADRIGEGKPRTWPVSTSTLALSPVRRGTPDGACSIARRTGTRWTTLTQLPVAFCAGSSENSEPVPAPMLSTVARISRPG